MSYEIIRGIKVKDNKVFVKASSNNVYPKDFSEEEAPYLTNILQKEGKDVLDISIMEAYERGTFQGGANKYVRALQVLRHSPEYQRFDWRNNWEESKKTRGTQEYKDLLLKALNTRLPKDKFIVSKDYFGTKVYLWKITKRACSWIHEIEKAKIFRYKIDADNMKGYFTNSENWKTEQL